MMGLVSGMSIVPGKEAVSRSREAISSCSEQWGGPAWLDRLIASMIRDRRQFVFRQLTGEGHCATHGKSPQGS